MLRIAAAGDIHCSPAERARIENAFGSLDSAVDVVLLAGDLTTHGAPEEAAVLADAGIHVLERRAAICTVDASRVGVAGVKGFVGGFPDAALPDFGEPSLRRGYAGTAGGGGGLDRGGPGIDDCDFWIFELEPGREPELEREPEPPAV